MHGVGEEPVAMDAERALERGLTYAEKGRVPIGTPFLRGAIEHRHLLGGELRKGLRGVVAEVVLPPERVREGESVERQIERGRRVGALVTYVPESVPFMPLMAVRDERPHGVADRLLGPGGFIPLYREVEFESIAFNERYRVGYAANADENWLRQLFAPTFLDWLASRVPEGCYWELMGGYLGVSALTPPTTEVAFEGLCELGAGIAERLRSEALEIEGLGPRRRKPAQAPPKLEGKSGFLVKLIPGVRKGEERGQDYHRELEEYARTRGLGFTDGRGFQIDHLNLPLAMPVAVAMPGKLPSGREGELLVCGAPGATEQMFAVWLPTKRKARRPSLRLWPRNEIEEGTEMIAGFPIENTEGLRRPPAEESEPLGSEELLERYLVVLDDGGRKSARKLVDRVEPWLRERSDPCMLMLVPEGAFVYGLGLKHEEFAPGKLDDFAEQASELAATLE